MWPLLIFSAASAVGGYFLGKPSEMNPDQLRKFNEDKLCAMGFQLAEKNNYADSILIYNEEHGSLLVVDKSTHRVTEAYVIKEDSGNPAIKVKLNSEGVPLDLNGKPQWNDWDIRGSWIDETTKSPMDDERDGYTTGQYYAMASAVVHDFEAKLAEAQQDDAEKFRQAMAAYTPTADEIEPTAADKTKINTFLHDLAIPDSEIATLDYKKARHALKTMLDENKFSPIVMTSTKIDHIDGASKATASTFDIVKEKKNERAVASQKLAEKKDALGAAEKAQNDTAGIGGYVNEAISYVKSNPGTALMVGIASFMGSGVLGWATKLFGLSEGLGSGFAKIGGGALILGSLTRFVGGEKLFNKLENKITGFGTPDKSLADAKDADKSKEKAPTTNTSGLIKTSSVDTSKIKSPSTKPDFNPAPNLEGGKEYAVNDEKAAAAQIAVMNMVASRTSKSLALSPATFPGVSATKMEQKPSEKDLSVA